MEAAALAECCLSSAFGFVRCISDTLPRLSVLAAPFMYRREERYWIPGSFSVLACGSLALCPGILISRLAFGMLSCWLMLGLLFGLAYEW